MPALSVHSGTNKPMMPAMKCLMTMDCPCPDCVASMAAFSTLAVEPSADAAAPDVPPADASQFTIAAHPLDGSDGGENILGGIYTALAAYLLQSPDWRRLDRQNELDIEGREAPDLILGGNKAKRVNWERLGWSGVRPLVNFYRGTELLERKAELAESLRLYCAKAGLDAEAVAPATFVFAPGSRKVPAQRAALLAAVASAEADGQRLWIAKGSESNCAKHIEVLGGAAGVEVFVDGLAAADGVWVVQRYVENPLLVVGGRKFDIRVWVLLTAEYKVKLYREGVIRTASTKYDPADIGNRESHLTNHCVAVQSANYGKYEPTNEMWFDEFDAWVASQHPGKSFMADCLPQIKQLTMHTLLSVKERLANSESAGFTSFCIFGFDYMIDDNLRVQLLEVNQSPACADELREAFVEDLAEEVIQPRFAYEMPAEGRRGSGKFRRGFEELSLE